MGETLEDLVRSRPVSRKSVEAHKRSMRRAIRAYRLRELREASNLTQGQVAARLHVSQNRVSRIEMGDIERSQLDTLRRYVEAVGGTLHVEAQFEGERILLA